MASQRFNGAIAQVEVQSRGWITSPDTYVDVPSNADSQLRTLSELVDAVQRQKWLTEDAMMKQFGNEGDNKTGEYVKSVFKQLQPLMQFTPSDFDDAATFQLWVEDIFTPWMKEQVIVEQNSRETIRDKVRYLRNWSKEHGVNEAALDYLKQMMSDKVWALFGDKAPPTKKQARQEKQFTSKRVKLIHARLMDMKDNPDAEPLVDENGKKFARSRILKMGALFSLGLNATMRSGEITNLTVGDVRGSISRTVVKPTSSTCGLTIEEQLWDETSAIVEEYISSRRLERQRTDDALLFGTAKAVEMEWRSLCKDVLGSDWRRNMGIHNFSRSAGLSLMADNDASIMQMRAASGNSIAGLMPYIENADMSKSRVAGNDLRYDANKKLGTLMAEATKVITGATDEADLSELFHNLWRVSAMEYAAEHGVVSDMPAPSLHRCKYDDNGNIVSEAVNPIKAPRGRFELPRDEPT